jgi:hypothetical protein
VDPAGDIVAHGGSKLPQSPPFMYSLTARYLVFLTDSLQGQSNVRFRQSSGFFSDTQDTPAFQVGTAKQLYASIGLAGLGDHKWGSIELYGDNLLNRNDANAKFPPLGVSTYTYIDYIRPRNFGIQYRQSF